ncbi:conditional loss-of-growth 1 [Anaeramoeba ignava]|uniref:Conditional loss-of-growth 1 n=1 Tax=Anaeramoeba ignava TaxID=1746090 RepID=A0A9Q0LRW8_ANAIG|nr:conditional loss-of-growth 1 [Anaeramoeba ignava]
MALSVTTTKIKKLVYENTLPEGSITTESVTSLKNYFSDSKFVDIVYEKIMERVRTDKTKNTTTLLRSVQLIKMNLNKYKPSNEVMFKLDDFCQEIDTKNNPNLTKSLKYIRTLISRSTSGVERPSHKPQKLTKSQSSGENHEKQKPEKLQKAYSENMIQENENENEKEKKIKTNSRSNHPLSQQNTNQLKTPEPEDPENILTNNYLYLKTTPDLFPNSLYIGSLLYEKNFGGQFNVKKANGAGNQEVIIGIDTSKTIQSQPMNVFQEKISEIMRIQKKEEDKKLEEKGGNAKRKKQIHLFQYKNYSEQEPIELTKEETQQVFDCIIQSTEDFQTRDMASKIWIKIVLDFYVKKDQASISRSLSSFLELLNSEKIEDRSYAFSLLFNTCIHANLMADAAVIPFKNTTQEKLKRQKNNLKPVLNVQDNLFEKLKEMLYILVIKNEKDQKVWKSALNCLLFFIFWNGFADKKKTISLHPKVIRGLIVNYSSRDNIVFRQLIRILVNRLYSNGNQLDFRCLQNYGGLNFISELYMATSSVEVRDNLFVVLYDIVVAKISKKKVQLSSEEYEQIELIFELLKRFGAPQLFPQLFKYFPDHYWDTFVDFVFEQQLKQAQDLQPVSQKLSKDFFREILNEFSDIISQYWKLEHEFQKELSDTIKSNVIAQHTLDTIKTLLESEDENDQKNGESLLFQIMRILYKTKGKTKIENKKAAVSFFNKLAFSNEPHNRYAFLSITQRLVLFHKSRMVKKHGNSPVITAIIKFMNDNLTKVIQNTEQNKRNLIFMLDIVMSFISINIEKKAQSPNEESKTDNIYSQFLEGQIVIPSDLLKVVNLGIFLHCFNNLTSKRYSDARTTCFVLIAEKCKLDQTSFEFVGGFDFFKGLLTKKDPKIVYFASSFIQDKLKQLNHEKYSKLFSDYLSKAQKTKETQIIKNPYFFVRQILSEISSNF